MPIARLEGPDGKIHRIEVPEGATPQEIEAFAAENIKSPEPAAPQQKSEDVSRADAYFANFAKGIPLGTDAAAIASAGVSKLMGDRPDLTFNQQRVLARQDLMQKAEAGKEQYPVMTPSAQIYSGVASTLALPLKALSGPTMAVRAGKSAGLGGLLGGMYGFGEGENTQERASNAIEQSVYGTAFGAGGSVAADIIGSGYRAGRTLVSSLSDRAKSIFSTGKQSAVPSVTVNVQPQATTGQQITQTLQQNAPKAAITSQEIIPLTKGQATQNPAQQALEYGAQAGMYGDDAQRMALEARELQSQAAKKAIAKQAGAENITENMGVETAASIKTGLSQAYKEAKARTTAAYNTVGELSQDAPLQIAGDYVRGAVIPSLKNWARKGSNGRPWDLGAAEMSNAKRLYDQATAFEGMKNVNSMNFFRMEDWRGRVSQGIANSKTPMEKAFLSGLLERYDVAMKQLPREAIKNGDEAIIGAMEKARMTRKTQGVLFERSKLVKDIVSNDDLTPEQLYQTISSLGPRSGTYVRDILRSAGTPEAKAALQGDLKKSILGSVYTKALSSEVIQGGTVSGGVEKMISFDKLSTNLDKLFQNKTLMKQVFSPDEIAELEQIRRASSLIKSTKPGSKNYSNTAYTILSSLNKVWPTGVSANVFGVGVGSSLEAAGKAGASEELAQSLAPVLKGIADENTGLLTNYGAKYGRRVMTGGAASPAVREGLTIKEEE